LHGSFVIFLGNPLPGVDFGGDVAWVELAFGLNSDIRIVSISFKTTSINDVLVSIRGVSSVAATIVSVTIYNFVALTIGSESFQQEPTWIQCFRRWKKPSRIRIVLDCKQV